MWTRRKGLVAGLLLALCATLASGQVLIRDIPAPSTSSSSLCWDGTGFWVGDNSARLIKVSIENGAPLDTIVGPVNGSDGLAWDGTHVWTISGNLNRRQIYEIDPDSGAAVDSIPDPAAGYAGGMTWDGQQFWVSRYFPANTLFEIDSSNGAVLRSLPAYGHQPRGLAFADGYLWNSSQDTTGDFVYRINESTGEHVWQFQLPPHASQPNRRIRGLSWVDGYLWIVALGQNSNEIRIHQYDVSNAIYPDIEVDTTRHEFGAHVVGFPVQWTFSGSNVGNVTLSIDSAVFAIDSGYSVISPDQFPVQVEPLGTFSFIIEFAPPVPGDYPDTLWLFSNDPDEDPLPVFFTGAGLPDEGDIDLSPTELEFGNVWIPSPELSTSLTLEIHNQGSGVLTVTEVEIVEGDAFRVDPFGLPVEIDSQSFVTARVWFDPQTVGNFDGILAVSSDDPDEPEVQIRLSGSAHVAAFEPGESIWYYRDFSDDFDIGINAVHAVGDVNDDGTPDVIASSGSGLTFCLNGRSSIWADTLWTFNTRGNPNHSGAVYYERALSGIEDITGDDVEDVILGTAGGSRSVYALSGQTGEQLWMFDTEWWGDGGWVNDVEPAPDLNGDFVADVVAAGGDDGSGTGPRRVFALSGQDGSLLWEGPAYSSFYAVAEVADVNEDRIPDFVGGTSSWVVGVNGASGARLWQTSIGSGSPVFNLENMGNANPSTNTSEDVVVASAYLGVYSIDGQTGQQIWLHPVDNSIAYEVTVGSDLTSDDVREVYVGLVSGHVLCLDGASGDQIWDEIADPVSPENILAITAVPDVTGDLIDDIVCGTLGDYLVVLHGWDGDEFFSTTGNGVAGAMDAVGILPDVDNNGSWEILYGNRSGTIECLAGGNLVNAADPRLTLPSEFALYPAYPNPFNSSTTISYSLAEPTRIELRVYDVLGRMVSMLVDEVQPPGRYRVPWYGRNSRRDPVGSGFYFVTLTTPKFTATQRLVLLK